jgi:hypothetical protein
VTEHHRQPIDITRDMMTPSPEGHDMPHLLAPVLLSRQALAAYFVRECDHVIELGGHKAPITPFLMHGPKSVVSVDPKTDPLEAQLLHGKPCRVRHLATKFQLVNFDVSPGDYGLVILGYSLKGLGEQRPDDEPLFELIDNAKITVIDHVIDHHRADAQLPHVLQRGTVRELFRIDLTFHDEIISGSPYSHRRMLVLEPADR